MPRIKSSPSKRNASANSQTKTWVVMLQSKILNVDNVESATPDIVKLRHPRTGVGALFLFAADNSIVQEVLSFSEKRSWFVNDSVKENGKMYFSTPMDPLFLVLPYLKKSKEEGKVVPMDDLLIDDLFPETYRLLKCPGLKNIHLLADRRGTEDLNAWMYNEEKAMKWLCQKTERVVKVLKDKKIAVGGGASSKNFIKSVKDDNSSILDEAYLRYAHEVVSEYLTDDLSQILSSRLGLPEEKPEKNVISKRKSSRTGEEEDVKKVKLEEDVVEPVKQEKPKPLSSKEKAMVKAASGSKSITSFFKKK